MICLAIPEGLQLYLKETPTRVFSYEYSKSYRYSFFIEQLPWSKGNDVTTSNGKVPCGLISTSCFYCPNFVTVVLLWLEIKSFITWLWANDVITPWGRVPNGILQIRFTCCPNQTLSSCKVIFILLALGK